MAYKVDPYHKSIADLLKRESKARDLYERSRSLHEEAFDYAMPDMETFRSHSEGEKKNRHVYDSTAIDCLEIFANKIQQGYFPEWQYWAEFRAGDMLDDDQKDEIQEALELATKIFFSEFQQSNFNTEITPCLKEYGIGTGCLEVESGVMGRNEPAFHFIAVPLAELEIEPQTYGDIKNTWRRHKITLESLLYTWPDAELTPKQKEQLARNANKEITILNGHVYNPKKDTYHQYIISEAEKNLMFTQTFKTKRRIAFRESCVAGEVFGRGPIIRQLPNIQTLNLVVDFTLRNAAIQIAGMYTGVSDGVFNPHTMRVAPGVIIPVSSNNSQNPTLQRLQGAGDIGLAQIIIKDLQDDISSALFAQPLGDTGRPVTSAMENLLRYQDDMRRSGTSFGRLFIELVSPLVHACIDILKQRGKFPQDIDLDGESAKIKMVSPLAKQKELEDFNNSQLYLQNVLQLPQEIAMIAVPMEKFPQYWADKLGIPMELRRSEAEIQQTTNQIMGMSEQLLGGMEGGGNGGSAMAQGLQQLTGQGR